MKSYKTKIFLALGSVMLLAGACKKSFFTGVNNNPNAVAAVNPNLLLPAVEISLGFTQGGDFSRYSSLITQQAFGAQQQTATFYTYGINPGTFENGWADMYTGTMENCYALMTNCDSLGYNSYAGIAKILMAYCLQITVDNWGAVPYSQALQGNSSHVIQPKYDSASALYDTIASLVDQAIVQFGLDAGLYVPGGDDAMYGGNTNDWAMFGHAIKARLYIHQSKNNPAMATNALAEIALSFTAENQSALYPFSGSGTTSNPWEQFMNDRAGYISFDPSVDSLIHQLVLEHDPRFLKLADTTGGSQGNLGAYYGSANSPVEFIMMDELLFMKAEATLRSGGTIADAQAAYAAAIDTNMVKLGVPGGAAATYITANPLPVSPTAAIAKIAYEEYKALFLNPEAWVLWRRTNSPALTPTGPGGVPRRLIYPQSEYSYNSKNVPASTLQLPRLFWDN